MGTAIHAFVEVDYSRDSAPFTAAGDVRSFNEGEFFVWRDLQIFHAFGLPPQKEHPNRGRLPFVALRGLPSILSVAVYYRYYHVVDVPGYPDLIFDGLPSMSPILPAVSPSDAEQWVQQGLSEYAPPLMNSVKRPARPRVSDPAWHSPSWLFLDELDEALNHYGISISRVPVEIAAIRQVMIQFDASLGHRHSRLTFWFDT